MTMVRKSILFLFLIPLNIIANQRPRIALELMDAKNPRRGMSLNKNFLKKIASYFNAKVFVETGTAKGHTVSAALDVFNKIYSIEISFPLFAENKKKFKHASHVSLYHGNSGKKLEEIVERITQRSVFWLDGHNSPGMSKAKHNTPLLRELAIIKKSPIKDHILLIDDIRCSLWQQLPWKNIVSTFGPLSKNLYKKVGLGWPSLDQICKAIYAINSNYSILIMADILIAYDQKAHVQGASYLKACLTSLQAEQKMLSDFAVINAEKTLQSLDVKAAQILEQQIAIFARHEEPWYHSHLHLWYGLALLGNKEYSKAAKHFTLASTGIDHWRVKWYRAQALKGIKSEQKKPFSKNIK